MLVIRTRGSCNSGMGRYQGSGMFDAIGRKLFSSGLKKVISSATNTAIAHKVANAVVNGASSASQKVAKAVVNGALSAGQKATESAVTSAFDSAKKKLTSKKSMKRASPQDKLFEFEEAIPLISKKQKILDIDSVINGSGIIRD